MESSTNLCLRTTHLSYKHIITSNIHRVSGAAAVAVCVPSLAFCMHHTQIGETPQLRAPGLILHNAEQQKEPVYLAEGLGTCKRKVAAIYLVELKKPSAGFYF